jgi:hypothetical protein
VHMVFGSCSLQDDVLAVGREVDAKRKPLTESAS